MKTLEELSVHYGCAKSHWKRGTRTFHFCKDIYPRHFEELRNKKFNLLEMGILGGGSLRMWRDYFPNANIYGLDIKESKCFAEERIKCFHGNQNDLSLLKRITDEIEFDIIIDDAGHDPKAIKVSFDFLFPLLKEKGIYVVEDLWIHYDKDVKDSREPRAYSFIEFIKNNVIDRVTYPDWADSSPYNSVHLYDKIAFIHKS